MQSTYSESRPEDTGDSYDCATLPGTEAQGSSGSFCQGYDAKAFVQKLRVFINFSSECLNLLAQVTESVCPNCFIHCPFTTQST